VARIEAEGGYLLYLRQEGRGIGLYAKLDAYLLQDAGLDTYDANLALGYPADERDYTVAAQMLGALGVGRVALLGNNPDKGAQLERLGVVVTQRLPTGVHLNATNARYLATKADKGGHTLDLTAPTLSGTGRRTRRGGSSAPARGAPDAGGGRRAGGEAFRSDRVAAGLAAPVGARGDPGQRLVERLDLGSGLVEQSHRLRALEGDGRALHVVLVVGRPALGRLDDRLHVTPQRLGPTGSGDAFGDES
jgi:hypothetical protein